MKFLAALFCLSLTGPAFSQAWDRDATNVKSHWIFDSSNFVGGKFIDQKGFADLDWYPSGGTPAFAEIDGIEAVDLRSTTEFARTTIRKEYTPDETLNGAYNPSHIISYAMKFYIPSGFEGVGLNVFTTCYEGPGINVRSDGWVGVVKQGEYPLGWNAVYTPVLGHFGADEWVELIVTIDDSEFFENDRIKPRTMASIPTKVFAWANGEPIDLIETVDRWSDQWAGTKTENTNGHFRVGNEGSLHFSGLISEVMIAQSYIPIITVPEYTCIGFEAPMDQGPVTVTKNRVLPLKTKILDEGLYEITLDDVVALPVLQVMYAPGNEGEAIDVTDDALPVGHGTEGNQFEYTDDGKWQYNLKTKNFQDAGTYTISIVSGDNEEYVIPQDYTKAVFVKN